jgi:site-specific DNA recombinase
MKERVVIYSRVSTSAQDTSRQIEGLQRYCEIMDYEVVEVISEVVSGKIEYEKRQLNRVFQLEGINGVVVSELSRLGRSTADTLDLIKYLNEKGIWVYSQKENLDTKTNNATKELLITILSAISTLERETTIYRSADGLLRSVKIGNWTGGVFIPYGYRKENKKLVIDEKESEIVKWIFQSYKEGMGSVKIATQLNKKRIPTRYNQAISGEIKYTTKPDKNAADFKWADGTVYRILTNPVYIGKKEGRKLLKGITLQSPAIIDEVLFNEVQELLKSNHKVASRRYIYILDKKVKCGCCGLTYYPHKRKSNKDNTYKCLSRRYRERCENFGIGIPKLNGSVWTIIRKSKDEIERILESSQNRQAYLDSIQGLKEEVEILKTELQSDEKKHSRLLDGYVDGLISKDDFTIRYEALKRKIENTNLDIGRIQDEIRSKTIFIENQQDVATSLRDIKEDVNVLKDTLSKAINKVVVYPVMENRIEGVFTNRQDVLVYIEVFTNINREKPLSFVISRRTNKMLVVDDRVSYDKETKVLSRNELDEEEEEVFDLVVYEISKIKTISEVQVKGD